MKKLLSVTLLFLSTTYTSSVTANDNWYIGALYSAQKTKPTTGRDFDSAGIIIGYQYNEYLSAEVRLSRGLSGYSNTWGERNLSEYEYYEDVDKQNSLIIKASYPILDSLSVYGLAGYINTKLDVGGSGINVDKNYSYKHSLSENGFSYGLGVSYQFTEQLKIFVDYQVLPDFQTAITYTEQDWDWKSTNLGINYVF